MAQTRAPRTDGEYQLMALDQRPTFGSLLKRYRRAAHLTQEQLAERAGYHPNYVGMLERGVRPAAPATIDLLADVLGLDAADRVTLHSAAASQAEPAPPRSPERAVSAQPYRRLPPEHTSLVGRERDEAQVVSLLRSEGVRLLTLTGPGGVGKTRLALRVADTVADDFADGVIFVPLASTHDPALVASEIAGVLGLRETGEQPLQQQVEAYLADKHVLLLLDNFEHLLEAAPLVAELLAAGPEVKVLVTSRAPLRIRGEQEFPVPPLALPPAGELPDEDDVTRYAAVALFVQRARAVRPDFAAGGSEAAVVGEICRRLDGLPLAIELAAVRVKVLPLSTLRERLEHRLQLLAGGPRDLPERQRTMRTTIAWSHDLLDEAEQRLFRRLAVFVGGCDLEAAEAVCNADGMLSPEVLDGLCVLVDNSLLVSEETSGGYPDPRFRMLETVREFALERLDASGEGEAVRGQHARYFSSLAERAKEHLMGPDQSAWLGMLEQEHDNLREALRWSRDTGAAELGLRLAASAWRLWLTHGHLSEGRAWLEGLLEAARGGDSAPAIQAEGAYAAGAIAQRQGDLERATSHWERSLALWRGLGDSTGVASSLNGLGIVATAQANWERAASLFEESLTLYRELGVQRGVANALTNLGNIMLYTGQYRRAAMLYEESRELLRSMGNTRAVGVVLLNLAEVAQLRGDYAQAVRLAEESLAIFQELHDRRQVAMALDLLGGIALDQGDGPQAARLLEESLELAQEVGAKRWIAVELFQLARLALRQGDVPKGRNLAEESLALYRRIEDKRGIAESLMGLGDAARQEGDYEQARALYRESVSLSRSIGYVRGPAQVMERMSSLAAAEERWEQAAELFGAAQSIRERIESPLPPAERAIHEHELAIIKERLGDTLFAARLDAGRGMREQLAVSD